jgi:hypothetical protein
MPELCKYRNCHNLASSTYSGYCNQMHYERGKLDELKEEYEKQLAKIKEMEQKLQVKTHLTSCEKPSSSKSDSLQ